MTVTFGQPTPAPDGQGAPIPVEIVWMHREGDRLTGLMFLGSKLTREDNAAIERSGKVEQWQITGGRRRATLDGFNEYADDQHGFRRLTPEEAARAAVDWLGFTGRPIDLKIIDETRDL